MRPLRSLWLFLGLIAGQFTYCSNLLWVLDLMVYEMWLWSNFFSFYPLSLIPNQRSRWRLFGAWRAQGVFVVSLSFETIELPCSATQVSCSMPVETIGHCQVKPQESLLKQWAVAIYRYTDSWALEMASKSKNQIKNRLFQNTYVKVT